MVFGVLAACLLDDVQQSKSLVVIWRVHCYRRPTARYKSSVLAFHGLRSDTVRSSRPLPQVLRLLGANRPWVKFDVSWTDAYSRRLLPESKQTCYNIKTIYSRDSRRLASAGRARPLELSILQEKRVNTTFKHLDARAIFEYVRLDLRCR